MSADAIRTSARAMVQDAGWPAAFPFHETVNTRTVATTVNALDTWCTLAFDLTQDRHDPVVGGTCFIERGVVDIVLLATAGSGDAAVMSAWSTIDAHVRGWSWPVGMSPDPPSSPVEVMDEPDGRWQRWDVSIPYEFHESA